MIFLSDALIAYFMGVFSTFGLYQYTIAITVTVTTPKTQNYYNFMYRRNLSQ